MPAVRVGGVGGFLKRQDPALAPEITPEFIEFTNAPQILAITGSFFAAAFIVVLLRCYVRLFMLKVFGNDDYTMMVALAFAAGTFACFVTETQFGLGKHFIVLVSDKHDYQNFSKVLYMHSILVMVGISCVKISIAFSLLRLTITRLQTRFLWGAILFIAACTVAFAGTLIFQCFPVEAAWDFDLRPAPLGKGDARCFDNPTFRNVGLLNSVFNIITDVLFAVLPLPLVWKLKVNTRTKVSLIVVLSLGWFACGAAIIKAVQQWSILETPDWSVHDSFNVWNFIELSIGIIAASLPAMKPLFSWALNTARAFSSSGNTKVGGRPSAYNGASSLGYQDMNTPTGKSFPMQSLRGKVDQRTKDPYTVQVSTQRSNTGQAGKNSWELDTKSSQESLRPLGPGPREIMMTTEVRID